MTLPYQDARDLVDAARARALDLGKALSIAVVAWAWWTWPARNWKR